MWKWLLGFLYECHPAEIMLFWDNGWQDAYFPGSVIFGFDMSMPSSRAQACQMDYSTNFVKSYSCNHKECPALYFLHLLLALNKCLEITANSLVGTLSSVNVSTTVILTLIYVSIMSGACACENEQLIFSFSYKGYLLHHHRLHEGHS